MILSEKSATFRDHALMLDRRAAPALEGQPNRYPVAAQTQSYFSAAAPSSFAAATASGEGHKSAIPSKAIDVDANLPRSLPHP